MGSDVTSFSGFCKREGQSRNTAVWPRSVATETVITGVLLSLARTLGLKQNICCVKSSTSRLFQSAVIIPPHPTPPPPFQMLVFAYFSMTLESTFIYSSDLSMVPNGLSLPLSLSLSPPFPLSLRPTLDPSHDPAHASSLRPLL